MADPVITIHDAAGDEITAGSPLALLTATPGTPTTPDTIITARNNDTGGPAVDPARNFRLSITARLAGDTGEPQADGLAFLATRALQAQVTAVSGGATALIRSYVPMGTGRTLALGEIPDGGIVTLGLRALASLAATISDVEIFLSWESIQSTALEEGYFETHGNWIYDGDGGGQPDSLFTEILSKTGILDPGAFDDTIDTWTEIEYVLEGVAFATTPAVPELQFDNLDGDSVALIVGEAYIAGIFLDGSDVFLIAEGLKGVAPLSEADRPATPAGTTPAGYVTVPFGLAIDTVEDVLIIGFFGLEIVSGLNVRIGGGQAAVSGRWVRSQTPTTLVLADDSSLRIFVQPEPDAGLEVIDAAASPIDPHSMWIWEVTTAAGAVTSTTSRRRIGIRTIGGEFAVSTFIVDAAVPPLQTVHVTLRDGIGIPILKSTVVHCYLSDNAQGDGDSTNIPDAITTGPSPQGVTQIGPTLNHFFLASDGSAVDATFDESTGAAGHTYFLVVLSNGDRFVSGAITPKP